MAYWRHPKSDDVEQALMLLHPSGKLNLKSRSSTDTGHVARLSEIKKIEAKKFGHFFLPVLVALIHNHGSSHSPSDQGRMVP
jgi:hypothetical protein